jgi:hypothetical protein
MKFVPKFIATLTESEAAALRTARRTQALARTLPDRRAVLQRGTQMEITKILILARKHLNNGASMESSARLCFTDAQVQYDLGNYTSAKARAVKSLGYSVGVLHPDYQRAAK